MVKGLASRHLTWLRSQYYVSPTRKIRLAGSAEASLPARAVSNLVMKVYIHIILGAFFNTFQVLCSVLLSCQSQSSVFKPKMTTLKCVQAKFGGKRSEPPKMLTNKRFQAKFGGERTARRRNK